MSRFPYFCTKQIMPNNIAPLPANTPATVFDDLMAADSAGDFFNTQISGKYTEKRIDDLLL